MAPGASARQRRFAGVRPTTIIRKALLGTAVVAATAFSADHGAAAQGILFSAPFFDAGPEPLISPRAVVYRLRDRGFSEIGRPRFDGTAYVIDATNPVGARVRLFVDARDGALIGRRRLDQPAYPPSRVARAAPGYGWTEEDVVPRRAPRDPEALVPPADIPAGPPRPPRAEANLAPVEPARPGAAAPAIQDGNPLGLNPDAASGARSAGSARRASRTTPAKVQAARTAPEAPAPRIESGGTPPASPAPAVESSKAATVPAKPEPASPTPAASWRDPAPSPAAADQAAREAPATPPAEKASSAEPKRNVRVIGGATIVPGTGESPEAGTN